MKLQSLHASFAPLALAAVVASQAPVALDSGATLSVLQRQGIPSQHDRLPVVEPHVSAHPLDPEHLLVAAQVVTDPRRPYQSCRLVSFVTEDGGESWTETVHDWWGYDPWSAIAADGRAVLAWIGNPGRFRSRFPIRFLESSDGGARWREDVQTLAGNHDGTKIAVSGSAFYFTTVRFGNDHGTDVLLCEQSDAGQEFREVAQVDGGGARLNFCQPAVLSNGTVLVPALRSGREFWVQRFAPEDGSLGDRVEITRRGGGGRGYVQLVADPGADSPHLDFVYLVRALGSSNGVKPGIYMTRSTDAGASWDGDRRIDLFPDDREGNPMVASAAVNRDGALLVTWVDRLGETRRDLGLFAAVSLDGGESFQAPVPVSSLSSNPVTAQNDDVANKFTGGGHYLGLCARADGRFQAVWSDSRSGIFQLRTATISIP